MKILITGGFGFIGSSLANKLYKLDHEIIILDYLKEIPKFREVKYSKLINIDLTNANDINSIDLEGVDCICHFAGQPSAANSFQDPNKDLLLNCSTTLNLIKLANRFNIKRFLYASTFNVYEEIDGKEIYKEEDNLCPKSPYANSKITSERNIQILCEKYNISYGILRMFNVYGPGQDPNNKALGMINIFLTMAINSNQIEVKGDLDRFRDFIYIEDVLNIWNIMIERDDNLILNVGTGRKSLIQNLLDAIISNFPEKNISIKQSDGTPGDFKGAIASIDVLNKKLNYKSFTPLGQGIKEYLNWAKTIQ
tara:strand:+ start:3767 stop:4693 length:927 start_codon:yes stop_codon:yes gene_type:complete